MSSAAHAWPVAGAREPRVIGETAHDRVTSLLMSVVLGTLLILGWLVVVYLTTQAYASRTAAPLELIEVQGLGGGVPEGEIAASETVEVDSEEAADPSNNTADASEFEEPLVLETPPVMLDAASQVGNLMADLSPPLRGGAVASGRRASRIGTGVPGYGFGPGQGALSREQRWSLLFPPGQTPEEYARQLDFFGIELATVNSPETLIFASHFAAPQPQTRIGPATGDRRLYFAWQGAGRKASDVELLRKAGIEVGEKLILQFCPAEMEEMMARLEQSFRGLRPEEIRLTRFRVVSQGAGYALAVLDQQPLR